MNLRKSSIVVGTLVVLGGGAWLVIPRQEIQEPVVSNDGQPSDTSNVVDVAPATPRPAVIEGDSDTNRTEATPTTANVPPPVERPEKREFESRIDSDPALSRELEFVVQRSLDAKLDRSRMELESLVCRGNSCQILLRPQSPTAGSGGMSTVSSLLRDLQAAPARHPGTGADLEPAVQMVSQARGEHAGILAVIAFENL